jgi:hypothetical protein
LIARLFEKRHVRTSLRKIITTSFIILCLSSLCCKVINSCWINVSVNAM